MTDLEPSDRCPCCNRHVNDDHQWWCDYRYQDDERDDPNPADEDS